MNPLQEKLNETERLAMNIVYQIGDELEVSVEKRQATNDVCIDFVQQRLRDLVNLTLEEAKKAVPRAWGEHVAPDCGCNMCYAHDKCSQQTLEALDKMKL